MHSIPASPPLPASGFEEKVTDSGKLLFTKDVVINEKNYTISVLIDSSQAASKDEALASAYKKIMDLAIAFKLGEGKTDRLTLKGDMVTQYKSGKMEEYTSEMLRERITHFRTKADKNPLKKEAYEKRITALNRFFTLTQNKDKGTEEVKPPVKDTKKKTPAEDRHEAANVTPFKRAQPTVTARKSQSLSARPQLLAKDVKKAKLLTDNYKLKDFYPKFKKDDSYQVYFDKYIDSFAQIKHGQQVLKGNLNLWDVHDRQFQDLALHLTDNMSNDDLKKLANSDRLSDRLLVRARNYAIGSRVDISWDGKKLPEGEKQATKLAEMQKNWNAVEGRQHKDATQPDLAANPGPFDTIIWTLSDNTLNAAERLIKDYPGKTAFINMANRNMIGGGYQSGMRAQEEDICGATDCAVTLGNLGQIDQHGRAVYPAGMNEGYSNLLVPTKLLLVEGQPTCNCIVHGFRDYRAEDKKKREEYKQLELAGTPKSEKDKLEDKEIEGQRRLPEIKADMRAVLRTAKAAQQEALVLGATGCGAFKHDAALEAKAWAEILKEPEFAGHFKEIIFAIPGGKNYKIFSTQFDSYVKETMEKVRKDLEKP